MIQRVVETTSHSGPHAELTHRIIGAAMTVHRTLGPGLLESAYERCLACELDEQHLTYECQLDVPIEYKHLTLDCGYRLDFLVMDTVIVELKSIDALLPIHEAQLLTYLKLLKKPVGLLINFNVPRLKDGIVRRVF